MTLNPNDVEQKAFTQALRGYHMDEVDDFLDEVVTTLRGYDQKIRDSQERIRALESETTTRAPDDSAISRAFVAAQRSADAMLAEAERDAEKIRTVARAEADQMITERDRKQKRALADMAALRQTVEALRERLRELAGSIAADLDRMDGAITDTTKQVEAPASSGEHHHHEAPPRVDEQTVPPPVAPQPSVAPRPSIATQEPAETETTEPPSEPTRFGSRPWERS
jgi:cell division initiation protein